MVNDGKWESLQDSAADGGKSNLIHLGTPSQLIEYGFDLADERIAQAGCLAVVPSDGGGKISLSRGEEDDLRGHLRPRSRRLTSSHG